MRPGSLKTMQNGNWRDAAFPYAGWQRVGAIIDSGPEIGGPHPRQHWRQCGMCLTAICRRLFHLEHAGPPYRWLHVGEDCALAMTRGDLRTVAEREADAWNQERKRIVGNPSEFQRALAAPWSYEVFANFGWQMSVRGRPWRKLADGNVTIFDAPTGWKVAIYLDVFRRPKFSVQVYPEIEAARAAAWKMLGQLRAALGSKG